MFKRIIDRSETISSVVNNPADPYGPPLVRFVVRVRDSETGRWWYVQTVRNGRYTFTRSSCAARHFITERTARRHQANMTPDIMNH